jgi:hypothetical protein
MVLYWVAYEQSYLDLSNAATRLLGTGENKFFLLGQDADQFFQRLMRELGEGQPEWLSDPVAALVQQGEGLTYGDDREIGDLVGDYSRRVGHARNNRLDEDANLVAALQDRCEGNFDAAIEKLMPTIAKSSRHRRLYARSLQDAFDNVPEGNQGKIEEAVKQFQFLVASGDKQVGLADHIALIETLFDLNETRAASALADDSQSPAEMVLLSIEGARRDALVETASEKGLLDFYEARALQELLGKDTDTAHMQTVVDAYRRAADTMSSGGGQIAREAQDGLAQALVTFADSRADLRSDVSPSSLDDMVKDVSKAIEIHSELVEFSWHSSSSQSFAGALENLASDYEVLAKVTTGRLPGGIYANPLREAVKSLERAVHAYQMAGEAERATEVAKRLDNIRQKLRS